MIVHEESRSILLRLKQPEVVQSLIPQWTLPIDIDGHNLAVKFNLEAVRVLRNLGIKAPAPIRHYYHWPRPPRFTKVFDHQVATAEFATLHKKLFILNEMGTSKSASVLWAADWLLTHGYIQRVLILAPLSTLELVWEQEIFDVLPHRSCLVVHGAKPKRMEMLRARPDFYVLNHDGLKVVEHEIKGRTDIDLIIVDEASVYRNSQTMRYKTLEKFLQPRHRLWLLSGAPCPNAPTDAWALAKLVNPAAVPKYYSAFQREVMIQLREHVWVAREGARERAFEVMQPAIRFKKRECIDLPPKTLENRKTTLTSEQKEAILDMRQQAAMLLRSGVEITAVNAADKILKLRQILCGAIKDPESGEYHSIDHGPRLQLLLDCINEAAAKVLVIIPFKGILQTLLEEIRAKWKNHPAGWTADFVNGDRTPAARAEVFRRFKDDPNLKVLLCHPKVMAHGITATSADMIVFYAPIYSNDESMQVMDRIDRPGQVHKMTIVRIGASSLEWDIYATVEGKRLTQEAILNLYKRELL